MKIKFLPTVLTLLLFSMNNSYAEEGFRGMVEPIAEKIAVQMKQHNIWHTGCPMPLNNMRYLTVTYWGFDHKSHEGHLIVLKNLAGETLQIFQDLYQIKFPIEKMLLPETYARTQKDNGENIDLKSSEDNNTYGFFCREDGQRPGEFSPHSYGIALDVNPVQNPAKIANHKIVPITGKQYFDRNLQHEGMVNEKVVAIFSKYGWKWGGYWKEEKLDYQHFQKDIDEHYTCPTLIEHPQKLKPS